MHSEPHSHTHSETDCGPLCNDAMHSTDSTDRQTDRVVTESGQTDDRTAGTTGESSTRHHPTSPGLAAHAAYQDTLEHLTMVIKSTPEEALRTDPLTSLGIVNNLVGWLQAKASS